VAQWSAWGTEGVRFFSSSFMDPPNGRSLDWLGLHSGPLTMDPELRKENHGYLFTQCYVLIIPSPYFIIAALWVIAMLSCMLSYALWIVCITYTDKKPFLYVLYVLNTTNSLLRY
jgi:hypothetical protein